MSKQVKVPRFYVDIPTFLHATGQIGWSAEKGGAELLYMNCQSPVTNLPISQDPTTMFLIGNNENTPKTSFPINFCALLNHNFGTDTHIPKVVASKYNFDNPDDPTYEVLNNDSNFLKNVLNMPNHLSIPMYNGTSIWTLGSDSNGIEDYWTSFQVKYDSNSSDNISQTYVDIYTHQLGSMVLGKYFDCPNSPDLNVTISRSFKGIQTQTTASGKKLSNVYYDGPMEWIMNNDNTIYTYPPFELDTTTDDFNQRVKSKLGRKGLRSWKLTFSYISESDMWIDNEVSNNIVSDSVNPNDNIPSPILSDNSFNFVWNCTLGGTLPFIFQEDNSKTGNNPDRFAICNIRENTFNVQQVAYNTYKVSMTIDEIS